MAYMCIHCNKPAHEGVCRAGILARATKDELLTRLEAAQTRSARLVEAARAVVDIEPITNQCLWCGAVKWEGQEHINHADTCKLTALAAVIDSHEAAVGREGK